MSTDKIAGSQTPNSSKRKPIAIGKACPSEIGSLPFGMPAKLPMASLPLSGEFRSMMPSDLKELLRAFNDHGVKYLIVGGYAFGVHAEPRRKTWISSSGLTKKTAKLCFAHSPNTEHLSTVSVRLILWMAPCSRSASLLPEWTSCSTFSTSRSCEPRLPKIQRTLASKTLTVRDANV
jgi:hypothetical protein